MRTRVLIDVSSRSFLMMISTDDLTICPNGATSKTSSCAFSLSMQAWRPNRCNRASLDDPFFSFFASTASRQAGRTSWRSLLSCAGRAAPDEGLKTRSKCEKGGSAVELLGPPSDGRQSARSKSWQSRYDPLFNFSLPSAAETILKRTVINPLLNRTTF